MFKKNKLSSGNRFLHVTTCVNKIKTMIPFLKEFL